MLELVGEEADRIDSRFLEPACGAGNFLAPVLQRKLASVTARYARSEFECQHQALLALMSVYGIELLADNVAECREHLLAVFVDTLRLELSDVLAAAAAVVLMVNIVHGDALTMTKVGSNPQPITFAEWSYRGKGVYQRRDFRFDSLTQVSTLGVEDSLFADLGSHDMFTPVSDHGALTVADIAGTARHG